MTVLERVRDVVINERGDNRKPGITWGQWVSEDCHYLQRWILNFGLGSVRVHHWIGSDDPRAVHDHPWWFLTFVVRGGYTDWTVPKTLCSSCGHDNGSRTWDFEPTLHSSIYESRGEPLVRVFQVRCRRCSYVEFAPRDHLRAPAIRYRSALHPHTVQVDPGGCWTIMLTGRHRRDWGFWVNGQWKRMRRYFKDHGHHQCD